MAGEGNYATDYELINSGKLVNKEGLLELSKNIKEYVAENAGGSSGGRIIEDITISSQINSASPYDILNNTNFQNTVINWFKSYLDDDKNVKPELYNVMGRVKLSLTLDCFITVYPIHQESNPYANYNKHWLKYEIFNTNGNWNNNVPIISYGTMWKVGTNWLYQIQSHSTGQNYILPTIDTSSASAYDVVSKYILKRSITGKGSSPAIVEDTWINETDLATELNIPSIPASSSTDGTYMLVDTVSSGTSTKSWETVPSGGGGGTTYTAGTGIDIDANNEISVDATDLSYNDLQDKPTIPTVPTNISAFTNDAGYLTSHQSLTGYATQNYVDNALSQVPSYSAGTGISIDANGVISLALANASEEAM